MSHAASTRTAHFACLRQAVRAACLPIAALLTLLLVVACNRPEQSPPSTTTTDAPPAPAASGVTRPAAPVLLVSDIDLLRMTPGLMGAGPVITGALQPARRAELRAELGATVQQVLKENGQAVTAGELLVRLDDTALRESLASAEEAVRASTAALAQADRAAGRLRTLQAQGMTTTQALEDAEQRRIAANSEVVAARSRVAAARQQLRRTEVRAPFAGVLSERKVSVGDTAQMGMALAKVIDPRSMRFEGLVSADRVKDMQTGQTVLFTVNGYNTTFQGAIQRLDVTASAGTRQLDVQVAFKDPAQAPRVAGLFAEGTVQLDGDSVLVLPESALVRSGEQVKVWRLQDQQVRLVPVTLGVRDARTGLWPVQTGLSAGDRLLRNPGSNLQDGQGFEMASLVPPAAALASAATR